jgi:hypothetical protein
VEDRSWPITRCTMFTATPSSTSHVAYECPRSTPFGAVAVLDKCCLQELRGQRRGAVAIRTFVQPLPSLTDLALGLVTVYLVRRLPRDGEVSTHWRAAFAWAVGTALAGAVYHGVFVGIPRVNHLSWAVMSVMVVVVMSYLLAASVAQVLGRRRAVVFWAAALGGPGGVL